jgi:hypothetical protein
MELRDLIVTPLLLMAVYIGAYAVRSYVTDGTNRAYFIPGLTVRVIGALAVGFIYQFYYDGGDTFAYHTHGSRLIWKAFMDNPTYGFELLFSNGTYEPETFQYAQKIWYFRDPQSYFIIRVAAVLDLFTFSTYSATALLFAVISFIGAWLLFKTFYDLQPELHRWTAFATLFMPTVFFWGSGIFKDTLTLAALGVAMYCVHRLFVRRRKNLLLVAALLLSLFVIFSIKKYILLCFLPVLLIWLFSRVMMKIRSVAAKVLLVPLAIIPVVALMYLVLYTVGQDDARYNVQSLAQTARITAYDIRYGWGARTGETSGYTLGELDGTWQSMVRLALPAINVSLFRPYLWEVRNPLMLLSALESLFVLVVTLKVIYSCRWRFFRYLLKPEIILCLGFAIIFGFAVGVSTYNFGTLSRYKIPMVPFYLIAMALLQGYSNRERNNAVLA